MDPDPSLPEAQKAFETRSVKSFARHSRLGGTNLSTVEQVREDFMSSVVYLRSPGFKRISFKTGSYGMEELAMAIKFATDAKLIFNDCRVPAENVVRGIDGCIHIL